MYKYSKLLKTVYCSYSISFRTNNIQPLTMIISLSHTNKTNINVLTIWQQQAGLIECCPRVQTMPIKATD